MNALESFKILSSLKCQMLIFEIVSQVQMSDRREISQPNEISFALIETLTLPGHDGDTAFLLQRNAGRDTSMLAISQESESLLVE